MKKIRDLLLIIAIILSVISCSSLIFVLGRNGKNNTNSNNQSNQIEKQIDLSNVVISCLGDSITNGGYLGTANTYPKLLKEQLNNLVCLNYGIGGSSCASRPSLSNDTGMVLRYNKINKISDIIIVMCGVNDGMSNVPLGNIDDTDITTYYGALNTLCSGLKENYPNAWVFFMTNFAYSNSESTNSIGVSYKEYYCNAVKAVCEKHNVDVFDTFNLLEFDTSTNTSDTVHPKGEYLSNVFVPAIAQYIKTNYKQK